MQEPTCAPDTIHDVSSATNKHRCECQQERGIDKQAPRQLTEHVEERGIHEEDVRAEIPLEGHAALLPRRHPVKFEGPHERGGTPVGGPCPTVRVRAADAHAHAEGHGYARKQREDVEQARGDSGGRLDSVFAHSRGRGELAHRLLAPSRAGIPLGRGGARVEVRAVCPIGAGQAAAAEFRCFARQAAAALIADAVVRIVAPTRVGARRVLLRLGPGERASQQTQQQLQRRQAHQGQDICVACVSR